MLATEARLVRPDGEVRVVAVHARITSTSGQATGVWGTAQDVTEQRQAEHALDETTSELAREQTIVDQLQRAILPRLPELADLEVAARYLPAGSGARVGGDWYDVFLVGEDRLVFSIGDVAGHGLGAASLMAQLRNALRGAAYCGASPSDALGRHRPPRRRPRRRRVRHLHLRHRATSAITRSSGPTPGIPRCSSPTGADRLSTWPPPTSRRSAWAPTAARSTRTSVGPGSLLLAYTDGLIEQPDESLDVGLARLLEVVDKHRDDPLDDLCESLGMTMFEQRVRRDDVCVLALRTHG